MSIKDINTASTEQSRTPEFSEKDGVLALTDESLKQFFSDLPDPEQFKEFYDQRMNLRILREKYNNKSQGEGVLKELWKTSESKDKEYRESKNIYVKGKNVDELTLLKAILNDKIQIVHNSFGIDIHTQKMNKQERNAHTRIFDTLFLLLEDISARCLQEKNILVSAIQKINALYKMDLFETLQMHYHPDRLDETTLRKLYDAAEHVLSKFEHLPALAKEKGIDLPGSAVYDGSKKGGFLTIYQVLAAKKDRDATSGAIVLRHQKNEKIGSAKIGEILPQEDPQYGTKALKYEAFADKKCESLIEEPHQILSGKTTFGIDGGIKIPYKGGFLRIGFSGRSQADDLGMVVATGYKAGLLEEEMLQKIQAIAHSPYLEEKMFSLLTQD